MRAVFLILISIHGLIHLLGFVKAFEIAKVSQLTKNISKPLGLIWLLAFLFFAVTAIMFASKNSDWRLIAVLAVITSQLLIISSWKDAKFGTIANIIILLVIILKSI